MMAVHTSKEIHIPGVFPCDRANFRAKFLVSFAGFPPLDAAAENVAVTAGFFFWIKYPPVTATLQGLK